MKIGDYVRTDNGYIGKIISITDNRSGCWLTCECNDGIFDTNANAKSSPNIIDLIEVGDLIKYHPIQNNYVKTNILYKVIPNGRELIALHYDITHDKKKILSIITHEQIEQMEYKINE